MDKENNGWISVDEISPDEGQVVLGYNHSTTFICRKLGDGYIEKMSYCPCCVTHWQPLPEPPKTK